MPIININRNRARFVLDHLRNRILVEKSLDFLNSIKVLGNVSRLEFESMYPEVKEIMKFGNRPNSSSGKFFC